MQISKYSLSSWYDGRVENQSEARLADVTGILNQSLQTIFPVGESPNSSNKIVAIKTCRRVYNEGADERLHLCTST